MKKLKLKLDGREMLSKDQMKKITGGYENCPGTVVIYCVYNGDAFAGPVNSFNVSCQDEATLDEICDINYAGSFFQVCVC